MYPLRSTSPVKTVLTVSQLTAQIKEVLEDSFDQILVVGEVSNAKVYPSGHWYFSLKDKDATLPCVCFKNANAGIKFRLEDGLQVVARGKLSVYPPRGAYQMVVTSLEPVGIGEWQLAFEQLREKLDKEGLLAPEKKRQIPMLPRKIGVVTSLAGAALRDILTALSRRNRAVSVIIAPCKVQGEGSPEEIAQAIKDVQEVEGVEVVLVARGGGSIEDLWSFNTEVVARAVAECKLPTISGVGHETDVTICDLVADLRAPTPTAAAELVAAGSQELLQKWNYLNRHLHANIEERLYKAQHLLDRLNPLASLSRYQEKLKRHEVVLVRHQSEMIAAMTRLISLSEHRLRENQEKLKALGPVNVLKRGFAIIRKDDGAIVRDAKDVRKGDMLEALLETGRLRIRVEEVFDEWGTGREGKEND